MICGENAAEQLIRWFRVNRRFMPWREDPTPYHIWVSEIMLQQTRVDTVMPYYYSFIGRLPDVKALAECPEDELSKLWEGLGYYSRVRNMKKAAEKMVLEYGGELPETYEELLKLPGIGSYTAGAISSIAFHRKKPVVDGNVLRVLSRLNGLYDDIGLPETKKKFEAELEKFLSEQSFDPSLFNQGLMELGALVCVPNGEPHCTECPWQDECRAYLTGKTDEIPVKAPKKARRTEEWTVFILHDEKRRMAVVKRPDTGLLSGMYGLPAIPGYLLPDEAVDLLGTYGLQAAEIERLPDGKHIFTHVEWRMRAYRVDVSSDAINCSAVFGTDRLFFADREEIEMKYALPSAFKKWNFWNQKIGL